MLEPEPQLRDDVIARLRAGGCVYAEEEAGLLIDASTDPDALTVMVTRRVGGEPVEQILGWAEFCGLRLTVRPGVFVPRRRTEALVRAAWSRVGAGDVVLDLCCGVGAVGVALAATTPGLDVHAVDLDPIAVDCARDNAAGAIRVWAGDLFAPLPSELRGRLAMICANAPYVPTEEIALMPSEARDHEAPAALDGGRDGLDLHRRIIAEAPEWLRPDGQLLIETGRSQATTDVELLERAGFHAEVIVDEQVDGTVVAGWLGSGGDAGLIGR